MEIIIALIGWSSVFIIIYACGNICDLIALKLKLYKSSWYFWLAGLVGGFFLVGLTDFPSTKALGWVYGHVLATKIIFTTWYLAILAIWGWGSVTWRISRCLYRDCKTNQEKEK